LEENGARNKMTKYNSLDDYLKSRRLDVDGLLKDSHGAPYAVKGRIIDAVVLFADMTSFSARSNQLSPTETLIFVNNFFAEICTEGLEGRPGIVDKYIGDEMMVVFANDFGSEDPVVDAVAAARWMVENDTLGFNPHIGIAAGEVIVGYVGTPLKYDCSVFGAPVTRAQRCCQIRDSQGAPLGAIVLPALDWAGRKLEQVLTKREVTQPDGIKSDIVWKTMPPQKVMLKGDREELEIVVIALDDGGALTGGFKIPLDGGPVLTGALAAAEGRAKRGFEALRKSGEFNPKRYSFEPTPQSFTRQSYP
jgi:class 3 adenylate cyclase